MAELKTQLGNEEVAQFLNTVEDERRREECLTVLQLMQEVTQEQPQMWGSMVGFGRYHYKYASGREGDHFLTGFSPRKQNLTLYIMAGFEQYEELMQNWASIAQGSHASTSSV